MKYQNVEELEKISKVGAVSFKEQIGNKTVNKCRALSSFWLCTFPSKDGIAEHLNADGYWESWITYWISANIQPGSVCVDAGSTYGYYTFFLAQHGCKVFSIEANSDLIPLLEYSNFLNGSFDRVTVLNKAVSDRSGQNVYLEFSNSIGGTSVTKERRGGVLIETIALDELLLFEQKIDFIKLDISSSEVLAWQGMQQIMKSNPSCICIMEFSPSYYENRGKDFFEQIASAYQVAYINEKGEEVPLADYQFFEEDNQNWRMLVIKSNLRKKPSDDILSLLYSLK
jgi:FkbM family methyltransferase